jgi:hypothetical protein
MRFISSSPALKDLHGMDTTATARRRGTQDGSAGNQQFETIVINVLVMQCVLRGFARFAQIREIEQCLERVIRLTSLLVSVSDFNPVLIQTRLTPWTCRATSPSSQSRTDGIHCSERTSCGIPSRRARPKFRVVRQGQRWQEV